MALELCHLPGTDAGERGLELLQSGHALPYTVLPDVWHVKAFRKVQEKGQGVGSTVGGLKESVRVFRWRRAAADGLARPPPPRNSSMLRPSSPSGSASWVVS